MTPVPLELPLRPAEAADLANLIFDHAEGKALSLDVRSRLAARAGGLKFQTITPFFGSLERDPVHHSVYYLVVDAGEPLLLHIALAAAPTSSIYYKPLLIGRMRRPNGAEMVINAIPFAPTDHANVETFAKCINPAFYPQPQGARTTITVEQDCPGAFDVFRAIHKRTGKNFAALAADSHGGTWGAMWAAIRAGWRFDYTTVADLTTEYGAVTSLEGREGCSRFAVGLDDAEKIYQQIRNARAAMKISRAFDVEVDAASPMTALCLRSALETFEHSGHLPQLVSPGPIAEQDLDEMAAIAQHFQITLSFRYGGESGQFVRAIAKAMAGRLDYRVRTAAEAEFVSEHLL